MKNQAKNLFIEGYTISSIATMLNLSRTAIYAYKKADKAKGIIWEDARFLKATDSKDAQAEEENFVALLIFSFEKALKKLDEEVPADEQIDIICKYINTYYKIKQQGTNPKVSKAHVAKAVIERISFIALEQEAEGVITFLSDHSDDIVAAALRD